MANSSVNEYKCDVVFKVNGQRIPATRVVLSRKSDVFKAMFSGNFKEANDKEIVIEDMSTYGFKTMIRYLRFSELNLIGSEDFLNAIEILKCGDRYEVKTLIKEVEDYMIGLIPETPHSSDPIQYLEFYEVASFYRLDRMKTRLNQLIDKNLDLFLKRRPEEANLINTLSDNHFLDLVIKRNDDLKKEIQQFKDFLTIRCCQKIDLGNGILCLRDHGQLSFGEWTFNVTNRDK